MTAYIRELERQHLPYRWAVTFNYSPAMVEALKGAIPSRQRKWCPDVKEWRFKDEAIEVVCELADKHCGGYQHVGEHRRRKQSSTDPHVILHLQPDAPPEVVQAVYRTLAKKNHPDRGGDTAQMQRINAAYEKLAGGAR